MKEKYNLYNLLNTKSEERYIPIKTRQNSDGTYFEYERDGDTHFTRKTSRENQKTLYRYNWRIKKYKIFMENAFNSTIFFQYVKND